MGGGARAFWDDARNDPADYSLVMESDSGVFDPRGIQFSGARRRAAQQHTPYLWGGLSASGLFDLRGICKRITHQVYIQFSGARAPGAGVRVTVSRPGSLAHRVAGPTSGPARDTAGGRLNLLA